MIMELDSDDNSQHYDRSELNSKFGASNFGDTIRKRDKLRQIIKEMEIEIDADGPLVSKRTDIATSRGKLLNC